MFVEYYAEYYDVIKSLHIIFMVSWMVGLFYLPRIFAYHSEVEVGSESDLLFQKMERRLLRIIMNPAMILTLIFGFMLGYVYGFSSMGGWFHVKMSCVLLLTVFHAFCSNVRKKFVNGKNKKSARFFKIMNEVPTVLMIISVFMVILKPFE